MNKESAPPPAAQFNTLGQWLAWQKTLHPRDVDLGLERVATMLRRLGLAQPRYCIVTVAGTNGKGSTVAFLEAMLNSAGYHVGAYTSPHLLRYNERVRVGGRMADDQELCEAFARVDAARGDITLSFFEFGTLAALQIFATASIDVAVLEVGLGGRLDAVNVLDADVAVITTISIDHTEWLGNDRESIGFEKAGIFRPHRPAVCADPEPPRRLLERARELVTPLFRYGRDYDFDVHGETWDWRGTDCARTVSLRHADLPLPALLGQHQLANAAAALMALQLLTPRLPITEAALRLGLQQARNPGRFQIIPGPVEWILDITHNPQCARALAQCLRDYPGKGRTMAVFGMLRDKDTQGVARALRLVVDRWYAVPTAGARGLSVEPLVNRLRQAGVVESAILACETIDQACQAAAKDAITGDRVVVCGSSYTVSAAMQTGLIGGE